jgi:hypothetical protein
MVIVERQAERRALQESRQRVVAGFERLGAEILPVELEQVERSHERIRAAAAPGAPPIERGEAIAVVDHHLAVDQERGRRETSRRGTDRWIARRPVVAVARPGAHAVAVPAHQQPKAVVLDLVEPAGADRGNLHRRRLAGPDEAGRSEAGLRHPGGLAVAVDSAQLCAFATAQTVKQ